MKTRATGKTGYAIRLKAGNIHGVFTTQRDAERYLEDCPLQGSAIVTCHTDTTTDWGADCPECGTRAIRAWDKGYTGTIQLWWQCPKCQQEFTR